MLQNLNEFSPIQDNTTTNPETLEPTAQEQVEFSQRIIQVFNDVQSNVNSINPIKIKMLEIIASCKNDQDTNKNIFDRFIYVITHCPKEKQNTLIKALSGFLNKNRITTAKKTQEYINAIKQLYEANAINNNDIANQYRLKEKMILDEIKCETEAINESSQNVKPELEVTDKFVEEIKVDTEAKKSFIELLQKHVEPYEYEWFEDQTRVRHNNSNLLVSAEKNGVNTLGAFISTSRGSCGSGQNIRFRAGVYHGSTLEKLSKRYAAQFSGFRLSASQRQQFLESGKTSIKIYFKDFLLCSIYLLPNKSTSDLEMQCLNYSEHRMDIPTNDELDHQVDVSINDNYAVNMFKDCLYCESKQCWSPKKGGNSIPELTIDNLIYYGLITVEGDEDGKRIFDDLLTIVLPEKRMN